MQYALYTATVLGAVGLLLMMPRRGYNPRKFGAVLAAGTLGGLWLWLGQRLPADLGMPNAAFAYYYVFSFIAIASAVRVITHTKPVYAALWFIMVVLASAGLFLSIEAEFIAFAMVIIYGGAILVTYVFVIMLASRTTSPDEPAHVGEYDTVAREPAAAIIAGFLLLAVLLSVTFDTANLKPVPQAQGRSDQELIEQVLTNRAADRLRERVDADSAVLQQASLDSGERVGLDLFEGHPLGLELAGVILLVSLVGAVVIARQRVYDEPAREAASR